MADIRPITEADETAWTKWRAGRPKVIRDLAKRFRPWKLYRMTSTGHRVIPYSFSEDGTMTVVVSARYNLIRFERRVFGINPDDLVECDLPPEGELVGETLTPAQQLAYINDRRAENGLPPLTEAELGEMAMDGECAMSDTEREPH